MFWDFTLFIRKIGRILFFKAIKVQKMVYFWVFVVLQGAISCFISKSSFSHTTLGTSRTNFVNPPHPPWTCVFLCTAKSWRMSWSHINVLHVQRREGSWLLNVYFSKNRAYFHFIISRSKIAQKFFFFWRISERGHTMYFFKPSLCVIRKYVELFPKNSEVPSSIDEQLYENVLGGEFIFLQVWFYFKCHSTCRKKKR